jgi:hypothetical protein
MPTFNLKIGTSRKFYPKSQLTKLRLLSSPRSYQMIPRLSRRSTLRWPKWPKLYPRLRLRYSRLVAMSIKSRKRRLNNIDLKSSRKRSSTRNSSRFKRPVKQVSERLMERSRIPKNRS